MKNYLLFFIIIIFACIQVTALNYFRIFSVKPDILFISMVAVSLLYSPIWAISFSIFAGMLKDLLGVSAPCLNTVLFPIWCLIIIRLGKKISLDSNLARVILIFLLIIINDIVVRTINLSAGSFTSSGIFFKILFLESIYTALVSPLIFRAIQHPFFAS